jgi:arabinogalactan endo-1,4-beta-galactosidase
VEEEQGVEFRDGGVVKPGLDIFRDHGYDWIRLRLFHTPDRLPNDPEYTVALAREAKSKGYRFLLDFHYVDHWADPQQQWSPAAWDTTSIDATADSLFAYTRDVIATFRKAGAMPEMVQIGNEVRNGMVWPLGRLPDHWDNFARLFKAGLDGIDAGRGTAPRGTPGPFPDDAPGGPRKAFLEAVNEVLLSLDSRITVFDRWKRN